MNHFIVFGKAFSVKTVSIVALVSLFSIAYVISHQGTGSNVVKNESRLAFEMKSKVSTAVVNTQADILNSLKSNPQPFNMPHYGYELFINPGHGLGEDGKKQSGTRGSDGTTEREVSLGIAKALYDSYLDADSVPDTAPATVLPVGFNDEKLSESIAKVKSLANDNMCVTRCFLVSIHANWSPDPNSRGAIAFYDESVEGAKAFAEKVVKAVDPELGKAVAVKKSPKGYLGIIQGVKEASVKSVLLEVGFMTNDGDLAKMKDYDAFAKKLRVALDDLTW